MKKIGLSILLSLSLVLIPVINTNSITSESVAQNITTYDLPNQH